MNFEDYLNGKKIDGQAFLQAEPELYSTWKNEFEQMHPNSFTVQKLNLINPIRRKYLLKEVIVAVTENTPISPTTSSPPKMGKPVIKPKPKLN